MNHLTKSFSALCLLNIRRLYPALLRERVTQNILHQPLWFNSFSFSLSTAFKSLLFLSLFFVSFLFISCAESPLSNNTSVNETGSRTYNWSSDVLTSEGLFYVDIWGSDKSHIWVVGPTGNGNKRLQRYNGYYWQDEGNFPGANFFRVNGSDGDNVWAATSWGEVWKRIGNGWQENIKIKIPNFEVASITSLLVENETSVLVGGSAVNYNANNRLFVSVYDGSAWRELALPNIPGRVTKIIRDPNDRKTLFLEAQYRQPNGLTDYYFYSISDSTFKMIYHEPDSAFLSPKIRKIGNEVVFGIGSTLNIFQNGKFVQILDWGKETFNFFAGRNRNDIFTLNSKGIAHYNGLDIKQIYDFPNNMGQACQITVNDDAVIVLANSNGNNIIYKGLLNK